MIFPELLLILFFVLRSALFEMEEDGSRSAVLNADWLLNPPNEYKASDGVTVRYSRNDDSETIEIEGPTKKTFQLMTITV